VIGDGFRARGVGREAFEVYLERGWEDAEAVVHAAPKRLAAEVWAHLGVALENEGHTDDARRAVQLSRKLAPDRTDTLLFLAELERDAGNVEEAIGLYRALLAAAPGAALQALDLAHLLAARDANSHHAISELLWPFRGHVSVELRIVLARALFEGERHEEVLTVTGPLVKGVEVELGSLGAGNLRGELINHMREATNLHDDSYAALHGREQVIESEVHRGRLEANSAANYRLLGEARMAAPPAWKPDTALRDVDGTAAFGQTLIAAGERSRGFCHLGVAALRRHKASDARDLFEKARNLDEDNFAAFLGIGAAIDLDQSRAAGRLARLPKPPDVLTSEAGRVLVDWPVLTGAERTAVHAALAPLERQLPPVAAAGAIVRVLPIDARLVDLPEFGDGGGERLEDERCLDAITGAATEKVCASKIEELLIFSGEQGWVFAHELAHLVHFHFSDERWAELDALFEEIAAHEYVLTSYQTRNVAEFFAVAYEDYLCNLYGLPSAREAGFDQLEPVFAFIDRLAR
jgi:tetratricopeptide (TPR) repeat protein